MRKRRRPLTLHSCSCDTCRQHPYSATAREHRAINRFLATLDEKSRRRLAGLLALLGGRGGVSRLADITGMSRTTIGRGRAELGRPEPQVIHERVRHPGGGRKAVEKSTLNF